MTPTETALQPYVFEAAQIREAGLVLAAQAEALVITDDETEAGTVGMVKTRGFQVVDLERIPRSFFLLDTKRIAAIYRNGGDVPGCEEDISYAPRTR